MTPEASYAISAMASLVIFILGYLTGRRGKKK